MIRVEWNGQGRALLYLKCCSNYELHHYGAPNRPQPHWELAPMVWCLGFLDYPGPLQEAVTSLEHATTLAPRDRRAPGLLG